MGVDNKSPFWSYLTARSVYERIAKNRFVCISTTGWGTWSESATWDWGDGLGNGRRYDHYVYILLAPDAAIKRGVKMATLQMMMLSRHIPAGNYITSLRDTVRKPQLPAGNGQASLL